MAINLNILKIDEDVDPSTRQPRIRVQVQELKPRSHWVNLKNCDASQINVIKQNVGGVMSLPAREMLMDGRFLLSIPQTDEEFFVIKPPETVAVSKVTELNPADSKPAADKPFQKAAG